MSDACCLPLEIASKLPWCKYSLPKEQSEESIYGSDLINSVKPALHSKRSNKMYEV